MKKIIISIILMIILSVGYFYFQFENDEITKEQTIKYLSGNLVNNIFLKKELVEREFFGPETDLTIIAGIDFFNPKNDLFLDNLEKLNGVKISFKYYIPKEEYDSKTGRYVYSLASYCYIIQKKESVIDFHRELSKTPIKEVINLAKKYDADLVECMKNEPYELLRQDMLDTETYKFSAPSLVVGIDGQYLFSVKGIGNIERINQKINDAKIRIGQ